MYLIAILFLLVFDALREGSTSYITDVLGTPVQYVEYLPFGEVMVEQSTNNLLENVYKFNGKELYTQTGYYYYGARYYDPGASIFLSVDPLAEQFPAWTPYHYVHNNPINLIDPTGMSAVDGDYYDKQGNWLFNDGIDDNKVYEVSPMPGIAPGIEGSGANKIEYIGQTKDVFKTWDPVTNDRILELHPAIRMKTYNFINETEKDLNIQLRVTTGFRSDKEQESLYWQSRDGSGAPWATNARSDQSYHNYGLAIDVVEISQGSAVWNTSWNEISEIGKKSRF
ncbi:RHS repeat-associated core domain-containing protein [Myroides sp. TSA_177.3]|uniref:RHS repeat-associated core domain-containing protein n=1 Tax=Myroides sp. TSA_177.3 TaxID=3415650 RepID=UPI00404540BB